MAKPIKRDGFMKDGYKHSIRIQQTGDKLPRPARIVINLFYWDETGGLKGWEPKKIYDRIFEDWDYAYALYDEILKRATE